MTRAWHLDHIDARTDHLDGWRADLVEQDDATIDITVAGNSRTWRAQPRTSTRQSRWQDRIISPGTPAPNSA